MNYLEKSADMSGDGLYRYSLSRRLSMGENAVLFVGLNPSTADATVDDPTVRRCAGFAQLWGFSWFFMGNLNAWRSTDPKKLPKMGFLAVGPGNRGALKWLMCRAELVVAAWGSHPLNNYALDLAAMILREPHTRCLGKNKDGAPKHPLYLPRNAALEKVD